ncbi:MAG: hypothetical protein ACNFW9_03320 [Candidatus Kerfeldbacteria bacterium]|jgi:hypothetical protein
MNERDYSKKKPFVIVLGVLGIISVVVGFIGWVLIGLYNHGSGIYHWLWLLIFCGIMVILFLIARNKSK